MAVIQDLPTELLYHILDFLYDENLDRARDRLLFLRLASLVTSDWTAPAQKLMLKDVVVGAGTGLWPAKLVARLAQPGAAQLVKRARFELGNNPAFAGYERILDTLRNLEKLVLVGGRLVKLSTEVLRLELLQDLTHLTLTVPTSGVLPHLIHPLPLTSLHISRTHVPDSVLQPLLANVPSLGHLAVEWRYMEDNLDPLSSMTHFDLVAPQLRALSLLHYDGTGRTSKVPAVTAFIAKCTSLTSIRLHTPPRDGLIAYLRAVVPKLAVLETVFLAGQDAPVVASAVSFPALNRLKTWRMSYWSQPMTNRSDGMEQWELACRAQGIKPICG
ncbi:hypothetical protein BCR35DRAFT_329970 [Leucosporidium creatinivorum]|uniref:F-box domain-containing protein n=1 Tax=Leucosporidium creatinivorum TaxID=106004 RepID=A0A1Y2FYZ4_9BASI|nr:hypothetical protein BCR35DRAFT_329970 [Leucosporidium creatinivorum]